MYLAVMALGLDEPVARVDVVEVQPLDAKLVRVDAAAMSKEITSRGSVALYGIHFDTDQARIKPESKAERSEIAKLLPDNPAMRLLVVGHTDDQGTFDYNMDLSKRRAQAVVAALETEYQIDGKRLTPVGVSFASPVASNKTEEGRAQNRRVQLVQQ